MTSIERGIFTSLFNRGGYVLDFSTNEFDVFTFEMVGIAICEKYGLSKGRSLFSFLHDQEVVENLKDKLLFDLLEYYENSRLFEQENNEFLNENELNYHKKYLKCKEIKGKYEAGGQIIQQNITSVIVEINSEYINKQVDVISKNCSSNPTIAIGKSKELVESICKTICEKLNHEIEHIDNFPKLVKETMKLLRVMPDDINDELQMSTTIKGICSSLASISNLLAELRNLYGDGHGKSSDYKGLEERHARLALGAASTLSYFLWETFKLNKNH